MTDQPIPNEYDIKPKVYGGVNISADEEMILKLPAKFATYIEPRPLSFKANLEKTFMNLRWKKEINRNSGNSNNTNGENNNNTDTSFYDFENKNFNLRNLKATSLPFNKRVMMPPLADNEMESKILYARNKLESIINNYDVTRTDFKQNKLTKGINSLRRRQINGEIICYPTDKSGSLSIDTPINYIKNIQPHLEGTKETTDEEYSKTEKLLNCHMQAWCRILNAGERTSNNFQASNNDIPPIYGLRKDHKEHHDIINGPPLRPVCGAITSCNYRISYFLSQILKPLIQLSPESCDSTEDLLSKMENVNKNENLHGCIVGSMDVEALYPSIDIDFAVDKCMELLQESDLKFSNVNTDELGLYLALTLDNNTLIEENIQQYCPKRKKKGKKPTITGCGNYKDVEKRWSFWYKAEEKIENQELLRKIISCAIGIAIKVTLNNHIFVFDQKIYQQTKGGAIGVGIAGDVANLFMVWWDRKFHTEILRNNMDMKLYSRYVDDTDIVIKAVPTGDNEKKDEKTMTELQKIANSIHPSIKVTIDFPSNHSNGRIPCLDTEQWIEDIKINDVIKPQLLHSHYAKPVSSKYVTLRDSAISYQSKINILVADLVRIMRNVSPLCNNEERTEKIKEFLIRIQHSGYDQLERCTVYRRAKKKYDNIIENDKNGICPLYRNKFWNQKDRIEMKQNKIRTWFTQDNKYDAVFFVDVTPSMKLAKECQKIINDVGLKIKVVEKSGQTLKQKLVRSNPFERRKCSIPCHICTTQPNVNCKLRETIYKISCDGESENNGKCPDNYEGESVRSIGERFNEHLDTKSVLHYHFAEAHNGVIQPVLLEIIDRCPSDAMLRQATEAVCIREDKPTLNCKTEFGNANIARNKK